MYKDLTYEQVMQLGATLDGHIISTFKEWVRLARKHIPTSKVPVLREEKVRWILATDILDSDVDNLALFVAGTTQVQQHFQSTAHSSIKVEMFVARPDQYSMMWLLAQTPVKPMTMPASGSSARTKALAAWGIEAALPITSWTALFYLLYARHIRGDKRATNELGYLTDYLTPQIKNYLNMACGGEARYTVSAGGSSKVTLTEKDVPPDIWKYMHGESKRLRVSARGTLIFTDNNNAICGSHNQLFQGAERVAAWGDWKTVYDKYGIDALTWCAATHFASNSNGSGISGALWGNAANLVRRHELQEITDLFFLDQAFSLQHNGGNIFNKLWDVTGLQQVLDAAFAGKLHQLPAYLKVDEHRRIYNQICVEMLRMEGTKQQGNLHEKQRTRTVAAFKTSTILNLTPTVVLGEALAKAKVTVES